MRQRQILRPTGVQPVTLASLAAIAGSTIDSRSGALTVTGLSNRSLEIIAGDLYAAVPGTRTHGARFAIEAQAAGARAVLTDEPGSVLAAAVNIPILVVDDVAAVLGAVAAEVYGHPVDQLTILGVTATSGKTTTAYLIRAGLTAAGVTSGLLGTIETIIGDQVIAHVPGSSFTTPEAPDLHALLAVMVQRGLTHVVMEVSSHALHIGRVSAVRYAVAGFGNLSQDHLDFHHSMEEYFAAKAKLFDGRAARHVVNIDDPYGVRIADIAPERTITISPSGAAADWRANQTRVQSARHLAFEAVAPYGDRLEVELQLAGSFNIANALMAMAMLEVVGIPAQIAAVGFSVVAVPGRMQLIDQGQDFLAVVDYAHKPAAVQAALGALRSQTQGKLILVLGCGGDRDRAKRAIMGAVGARMADLMFVTDDNPRTEDPAMIRAAMLAGAFDVVADERAEVREIGDRDKAIRSAVLAATAGDVVLVAGKGHEHGQYVGNEVLEFDDVERLTAAIALRSPHRGPSV
ncbi:MAG: UDP-N-acetylmuramoyl-L-alanyl-D-glutamate--2,6-diaminopimelate ligase [Antricoccus sp.]